MFICPVLLRVGPQLRFRSEKRLLRMLPVVLLCCTAFCAVFSVRLLRCRCSPAAPGSVPAEPVQWDLTPEAQLTYATLLLDQSIRNDDREGVLEASSILLSIESRPQPFIDAAAWLILNKENGEARNLLEKAILRVPGDLSLHLLLAETWINQGDNERAVHILQDYERAHPHSRMAKQELGILYVKTGRFLEADRILSALPGRHAHAVRALRARAGPAWSEQAAACYS